MTSKSKVDNRSKNWISISPSPKAIQASPFYSLSQKLESVAVRSATVAALYHKIFYKKMLEKEFLLADLQPGAKILHVGCGAYPYTALYLAQKGYRVEGLDCNETAVAEAKYFLEKIKLSEQVKVRYGNGINLTGGAYDAIWVSLNISDKERVLKQAFKALNHGGVLIYRNLPHWFSKKGVSFTAVNRQVPCSISKCNSLLGTESLVIQKNWQ